jgi:hypothetical protein
VLKNKEHRKKATNVWPTGIKKLAGAWRDLPTAEEIRIQEDQTKGGKKIRPQ